MSNLGPLTTTYTPSGVNCSSIYQTVKAILLYGTTSASTSSCMPPNFVPYDPYYYSPGVCPSGYTLDNNCVAGIGGGGTAATCCPSGYTCRKGRSSTDPNACQSVMQADSSFTIGKYIFTNSTTYSTTITQFYASGNSIYANGIVLRRGSDDPTWPGIGDATTTTTLASQDTPSPSTGTGVPTQTGSASSDDTSSPPDDLSTGSKVGIGIGVAFGAILVIGILLAAVLIGRRRRRLANAAAYPLPPHDPLYASQQVSAQPQIVENKRVPYSNIPVAELDEQNRFPELDARERTTHMRFGDP
ncbi:hypothetical protein BX600DRAFT_514950 [Xylariales sp. PMI_506]|nr:hypothetical protein BX600DRAFT_514950 [Xylariales sp. PMI_506]